MRLIDADTLHIDIIEKGQANERGKYIVGDIWELTGAEIREVIDSQPTIQPEIVRCKDCKHRYVDGGNVRYNACELNHNKVQSDDWFCADGERRENNESN